MDQPKQINTTSISICKTVTAKTDLIRFQIFITQWDYLSSLISEGLLSLTAKDSLLKELPSSIYWTCKGQFSTRHKMAPASQFWVKQCRRKLLGVTFSKCGILLLTVMSKPLTLNKTNLCTSFSPETTDSAHLITHHDFGGYDQKIVIVFDLPFGKMCQPDSLIYFATL